MQAVPIPGLELGTLLAASPYGRTLRGFYKGQAVAVKVLPSVTQFQAYIPSIHPLFKLQQQAQHALHSLCYRALEAFAPLTCSGQLSGAWRKSEPALRAHAELHARPLLCDKGNRCVLP